MLAEFYRLISDWVLLDTWIAITGALAAMSCALPGTWLFLRKQSLLGDALSHSILPGIVLAYLAMHQLETAGWISHHFEARHLILFIGAATSGVLSAIVTELIQRWGRMDRGAAIGVVFTSMFAFGILLIRMFADKTHVDPGCVLYGSLETSALTGMSRSFPVPQAAVINGAILLVNGVLVLAFFKELRLSTFDPGLAEAVGLNANAIQLALMAMTAATLVAAFESVGAILVIAMLIVPAATARLFTDRLGMMLLLSLVFAALSAVIGHAGALTIPTMVFSRLGYHDVNGASTTGMMALAAGLLFVLGIVASPRHGAIRRAVDRTRLRIRIAGEDLLGVLYRMDESNVELNSMDQSSVESVHQTPTWIEWLARNQLFRQGLITTGARATTLTESGRDVARSLVRSHRLWETYMARHFDLPGDHLHATAETVEHFLSPKLQTELAAELDQPSTDPHGKIIPKSN